MGGGVSGGGIVLGVGIGEVVRLLGLVYRMLVKVLQSAEVS